MSFTPPQKWSPGDVISHQRLNHMIEYTGFVGGNGSQFAGAYSSRSQDSKPQSALAHVINVHNGSKNDQIPPHVEVVLQAPSTMVRADTFKQEAGIDPLIIDEPLWFFTDTYPYHPILSYDRNPPTDDDLRTTAYPSIQWGKNLILDWPDDDGGPVSYSRGNKLSEDITIGDVLYLYNPHGEQYVFDIPPWHRNYAGFWAEISTDHGGGRYTWTEKLRTGPTTWDSGRSDSYAYEANGVSGLTANSNFIVWLRRARGVVANQSESGGNQVYVFSYYVEECG